VGEIRGKKGFENPLSPASKKKLLKKKGKSTWVIWEVRGFGGAIQTKWGKRELREVRRQRTTSCESKNNGI